jgi:hypothetical protein
MAITYTWEITALKTRTEGANENAVIQTYWIKKGTDEHGHTGTFTGATPFTSVDVPAESFVPFDQLTEEIVLGWIQSVVTGEYEQHVNGKITAQIDSQHTTQPELPWAPGKGLPAPDPENI